MEFREKAEVLTNDGKKIGRIDRVVMDVKSKELTHLVIKKGVLFTKDKVIPIEHVESAAEDRVVLKKKVKAPGDFPDFEETHYVETGEGKPYPQDENFSKRPLAWYFPLPAEAWWRMPVGYHSGHTGPPYVRRTELNIPDGTVPLEEGAKVVGSEGDHVGNVERVYADEEEQRATHLLISKGTISKVRKLIPTMWVDHVLDDEVWLSVDKNFVEDLPEYSP